MSFLQLEAELWRHGLASSPFPPAPTLAEAGVCTPSTAGTASPECLRPTCSTQTPECLSGSLSSRSPRGKRGPEPGCHPKELGSQAQLTSHLSKLGTKSHLLQVDPRRWPAPLARAHAVPRHVLQSTALVHLYLGRRRNQVSPHQAWGEKEMPRY